MRDRYRSIVDKLLAWRVGLLAAGLVGLGWFNYWGQAWLWITSYGIRSATMLIVVVPGLSIGFGDQSLHVIRLVITETNAEASQHATNNYFGNAGQRVQQSQPCWI